jgi:hypothetical protein
VPGAQAASRAATRLAAYKEKEHARPITVVPIGQPIRIDDFVVELGRPELADPETRLPWIANVDERAQFRGKRALVVPFSVRNDAPVARGFELGLVLHTPDGKTHVGGPYNERLAAKQRARVVDLKRLTPDRPVEGVRVFDVDPAQLEGAVLYAARWIKVRDRSGHSKWVVDQHAVADLVAAIEAPAIRGE